MRGLTATLEAPFGEGARLDAVIRENPGRLGYRVGKEDAP